MATGKPGTIRIAADETSTTWGIVLSDTGPGLPAKAQDQLFSAFQGSVRKGGSGLGLAIAAELIRGHGGSLELAHTGVEGTKFAITLPKGDSII